VIDGGANIGLLTLSAARHLEPLGGQVIAFEPNPVNCEALRNHIELNHLSNVTVERLGLSSRNERIFARGGKLPGNWSILRSQGPLAFEIDLVRLDDYLTTHSCERVDLIKLDVEGCELAALEGACETLNRFRPALIFEMNPFWLRRMKASPAALFAYLASHSYRVHHLTRNPMRLGRLASLDEMNRIGDDDWTNLLALPF
jgi:FkbM family methyltransferase